jgi:hypothetical protein
MLLPVMPATSSRKNKEVGGALEASGQLRLPRPVPVGTLHAAEGSAAEHTHLEFHLLDASCQPHFEFTQKACPLCRREASTRFISGPTEGVLAVGHTFIWPVLRPAMTA